MKGKYEFQDLLAYTIICITLYHTSQYCEICKVYNQNHQNAFKFLIYFAIQFEISMQCLSAFCQTDCLFA